ncbi:CTP synthetase [Rhodobacterales bacterium 52_120_T64]|nr:CTP synthetase [Rhodobacterales bacterium 52_120_T64]
MLRLATVLYAIVGTTMAGILVIAALVSGYDTLKYILIAAVLGAVLALPASVFIAKAIKAAE